MSTFKDQDCVTKFLHMHPGLLS